MTAPGLQAPGVYAQGRGSSAPEVIPTAITGFVGIAERGPIGVPQPLQSWSEYIEVFGNYIAYGHLAETVFAFFLNGGEKCWVVRAADTEKKPLDVSAGKSPRVEPLARAQAVMPIKDWMNNDSIRVTALDEGSWGNRLEFTIDGRSPRDMVLTTLRTVAVPADTVLQVESALDFGPDDEIQLATLDNPFVVRRCKVANVDPLQRQVTITSPVGGVYPRGTAISGRGFRIQFRYGDTLEVFDSLSIAPDHSRYFVEVIQGDREVRSYVARRNLGHSILARVEHVLNSGAFGLKPRSSPLPERLTGGGDGFGYASAEIPASGGPGPMRLVANIDRGTAAESYTVTAEPSATTTALPTPAGGDTVAVEDALGFQVGDNLTLSVPAPNGTLRAETRMISEVDLAKNRLKVGTPFGMDFPIAARASIQDRFDLTVRRDNQREPVERIRNLSGDPTQARSFVTIINHPNPAIGSARLRADAPGGVLVGIAGSARLANGQDPGAIDYRFYTGYEPDGKIFTAPGPGSAPVGLAALASIEEVSLVAIPDLHRVKVDDFVRAQQDILRHCDATGGRFAILDPPPHADAASVEILPRQFADARLARNGALYFPWVLGAFQDERRLVAPCGFVTGQIAASDRRAGVGKAPANSSLKGIVALEMPVDSEMQERLNPAGVNCIRKFEDGQFRLFGARTLSTDSRFQFLNVRRSLLAVIKALTQRMLWAVFEPNDDGLQRRIESALTGYLNSIVARGITASPAPDESFYVKCNAETNPSEVREAGGVIAEVGIAIAAPAEFIVLTARKSPESLSVVEEDA